MHQAVPGLLDLPFTALAPQLSNRFNEQKNSEHPGMAVPQSAATCVDRQFRSGADALIDHAAPLSLRTKSEILQTEDDADGERVINLDHVDVFWSETGHFVGRLAGFCRGRRDETAHVGHIAMAVAFADSEHTDCRLAEFFGALLARDHDRASTVRDQTDIELPQRDHL